jgi:Icc protein
MLAHVSDLHLGLAGASRGTESICHALVEAGVDHVVVTGDVTQKGRRREWDGFTRAFAPLLEAGRVTVVPGNHDRAEEDVASLIMPGPRVQTIEQDGLFVVRVDSTGPHNRSLLTSHGHVGEEDIAAVERALDEAPRKALVALALHHHLHPLPGDCFREDLVSWLGWPWCDELPAGRRLLERIQGRCDLVLHGHRHLPSESHALGFARRPTRIYNAGSSPALGKVRIFRHRSGTLDGTPRWLAVRPSTVRVASRVAAAAA